MSRPQVHSVRAASRGRFARDQRGSVAVEFALTAAIFISVLMAIAQIGFVGIAQSQIEYATRSVARQIMTGQVAAKGLNQSDFVALVQQKLGGTIDPNLVMVNVYATQNLSSRISNPSIAFDANNKVTNSWSYDIGNAGSLVVIQVMYRLPILLGPLGSMLSNLSDGSHLLISTAVVQNEP